MDERKPSFLEKMFVSVATGAACGALSAKANVDEETQKIFTGNMIDLALNLQDMNAHRKRKGYFDPDDPYWRG